MPASGPASSVVNAASGSGTAGIPCAEGEVYVFAVGANSGVGDGSDFAAHPPFWFRRSHPLQRHPGSGRRVRAAL